jgi:Fe-S cluster assembly protein SufD
MSKVETIQTFLTNISKTPAFRQVDFKALQEEQWIDGRNTETILTDAQKAALPDQALVWVNGIFQPELSQNILNQTDVTVDVNSSKISADDHNWSDLNSENQEHVHVNIACQASIQEPINLLFIASSQQTPVLLKHKLMITLGAGAHCQFALKMENINEDNKAWMHQDISWHIKRDAHCDWHQYCSKKDNLYLTQAMRSDLDQGAQLKQFSASANQAYLYHDNNVVLTGDHASYEAYGFYRAFDKDRTHYRVYVTHEGKYTKSNQFFRGILSGQSKALFDSVVKVKRGAKGTDSKQMNNNLLLDKLSHIQSLPILEINEEDVVCSHGATIGALDEAMLFYMQSRGLSEKECLRLMKQAFIADIMNAYDPNHNHEQLYALIQEDMRQWT